MNAPEQVARYLKSDALPVFWCPGCGNGIILGSLMRVFNRMQLAPERTVVTTGIGCWGKADDYLKTNSIHGTHGRALPFATGVKAANAELTVLALMGDGDCATIGGNHFLHAARRNIDVTAVISNNFNYGMTGGQYSATTPVESYTSTSVYGNPEGDFDLCEIALAAGATLVARSTVYHVQLLERVLEQAVRHRGFSVVEVLSSCPVYYGRYNDCPSPVDMMKLWRSRAVAVERHRTMDAEDRAAHIPIGVLGTRDRLDFNTRYERIQKQARAQMGGGTDGAN
ncbi:MAG: thiamine pyrophosphate-dependent enzyme [Bacillota bacterium]